MRFDIAEEVKNFKLVSCEEIALIVEAMVQHKHSGIVIKSGVLLNNKSTLNPLLLFSSQKKIRQHQSFSDDALIHGAMRQILTNLKSLKQYNDALQARYAEHFVDIAKIVGFKKLESRQNSDSQAVGDREERVLKLINGSSDENQTLFVPPWNTQEFFEIHLYSLLKYQLLMTRYFSENSPDQYVKFPFIKEILVQSMLKEIALVANAARIYRIVNEISMLKDNKEDLFQQFVQQFLKSLQNHLLHMGQYDEVCFPCGYNGLQMYLSFVHLKDSLLLRLDNVARPGTDVYGGIDGDETAPYLLTEIPLANFSDFSKPLAQYLFDLCLAIAMESEKTALPIIYLKDAKSKMFPEVQNRLHYPKFKLTLVNEAAAVNFRVGLQSRAWELSGVAKAKATVWLTQVTAQITSEENLADTFYREIQTELSSTEQNIEKEMQDHSQTTGMLQDLLNHFKELQSRQSLEQKEAEAQRSQTSEDHLGGLSETSRQTTQNEINSLKQALDAYAIAYQQIKKTHDVLIKKISVPNQQQVFNFLPNLNVGSQSNFRLGDINLDMFGGVFGASLQGLKDEVNLNVMEHLKTDHDASVASGDTHVQVHTQLPEAGVFSERVKLSREIAKRIKTQIATNIATNVLLKQSWQSLNVEAQKTFLEKLNIESVLSQESLNHFASLDSRAKDQCVEMIVKKFVEQCYALERMKLEEYDIEDGIEHYHQEQGSTLKTGLT